MRYYGGGPVGMGNAGVFNNSSIGGIPVGEDPRFPMSQEQFWNEADRIKIQNIPPGDVLKRFKEIHGPKLKGASVPLGDPMGSIGNVGGLQNAQFYAGPQLAQAVDLPDQINYGQEADYYPTPVGSDPGEDFHEFQNRFYNNTDLQRLFPNYPVNATPEMMAKGVPGFQGKFVS